MPRQLDHKKLKVGDFVLHFAPARLLDMDTVHDSLDAAKTFMRKLAKKQLHWQATITEVKDVHGCSCYTSQKKNHAFPE